MAKKKKAKSRFNPFRWLRRWLVWLVLVAAAVTLLVVGIHGFINPPPGFYMNQEARRLGRIEHDWVPIARIAPVMARSVVAAEDANFCHHWGFDVNAIRQALDEGAGRGASTISQQVVKNTYLWHGRNWGRKALEALITPAMELFWDKRRIIEVYLNMVEFDEGVFGVKAAARHYFGVEPDKLTPAQAARLAAVLPDPQNLSASRPGDYVERRSASIRDGAATIARDGRARCFE